MAEYLGFGYNQAATRGEVLAAKELAAEKIREAYEKSELGDQARRAASFEYAQEEIHKFDDFESHLEVRAWMARAACKNLQKFFFPPSYFERKNEKMEREAKAKAVCSSCTVREACLKMALASREKDGVWGGLNEKERQALG